MEREETQPNVGSQVRASWNMSLDQINENIHSYDPHLQQVLKSAFLWCIDAKHPVSKPEFARRIGRSDNFVYKIYTGKYVNARTGDPIEPGSGLADSIRQFLELEKERQDSGPREFVMTPTARRIWTHCDLARESQTPAWIIGPSQAGKTWALDAYQDARNHGRTVKVRMQAASGLFGMVRRIASACGVSDRSNTPDLIGRIKKALSKDTLLIIDEMHELTFTYRAGSFFACTEVIREIYDEVQCGMILCGTYLLDSKVNEHRQAELEQLVKRGVHRLKLGCPTTKDVASILDHHGLAFPSRDQRDAAVLVDSAGHRQTHEDRPYELLRQTVKRDGLKAITERIRYASKLANKRHQDLEWKHFIEAHLIIQSGGEVHDDWK